jgi:hypothetical protein
MAAAVISTNYDVLIEASARAYGATDFLAALDGSDARQTIGSTALLKIHGCLDRDRFHTVWSASQLQSDADIALRIEDSTIWLDDVLRDKLVVFIGFWSDWQYLNSILVDAIGATQPATVFVVDPQPAMALQEKAPALWELANRETVKFTHLPISGATFLDDVRVRASEVFLNKQYAQAGDLYHELLLAIPQALPDAKLSAEDLYDLRRDAEFVPRSEPATLREPAISEHFGLCQMLLFDAGATRSGSAYSLGNINVRLVNGAGRSISRLRKLISEEPPAVADWDYIICAGANDFGTPSNIVHEGDLNSVIRPASAARFLSLETAREQLGF